MVKIDNKRLEPFMQSLTLLSVDFVLYCRIISEYLINQSIFNRVMKVLGRICVATYCKMLFSENLSQARMHRELRNLRFISPGEAVAVSIEEALYDRQGVRRSTRHRKGSLYDFW